MRNPKIRKHNVAQISIAEDILRLEIAMEEFAPMRELESQNNLLNDMGNAVVPDAPFHRPTERRIEYGHHEKWAFVRPEQAPVEDLNDIWIRRSPAEV